MSLCSLSLSFLICKTGVWDRIFHPVIPAKGSLFQVKHSSYFNRPSHSGLFTSLVILSGIYVWSGPLELGYFADPAQHTLSMVCPTWGRNGVASCLVRSFWTYVSSHGFTVESPCSTLKVNCMKLLFATLELLPHPPSLSYILSTTGNTRTEKMTCLRWSCDKRWPNWDSRHHLCKTSMFLWKVATETIFALKTSRTWILAPRRIIWEGCCRCAWNPMGSSHTHDQFCLEFR